MLFPPDILEWVPANHVVHCVTDVVDDLDLSEFHADYRELRGRHMTRK